MGKKPYLLISVLLILCLSVQSLSAYAQNEGHDYIYEENFEEEMNSIVLPKLESIRDEGLIYGIGGKLLHYESYILEDAVDTIVIFHGISEAAEKYYEFIYYLINANYNVFILEQRGHGDSARFTSDLSKVDLDKWEYLIADQKLFMDTIVKTSIPKDGKLFLYGHSMGGCIGTAYLAKYTKDFDAAVISSPLYEYAIGYPNIIVNILTSGLTFLGKGSDYVPGLNEYNPKIDMETSLSSSEARVTYYTNQRTADIYQHAYSTTNQFMSETYEMTGEVSKKKNIIKITCPVLMLSAGADTAVSNDKQIQVASYNSAIEFCSIPNARHEMYMENDSILVPYLEKVLNFYNSRK